jgi:hypothetical protein
MLVASTASSPGRPISMSSPVSPDGLDEQGGRAGVQAD